MQRVPRRDNGEVDRLSRLASSANKDLGPGILVEHLLRLSIKVGGHKEVNVASLEPEWASQIIRFFKNGELPEDKKRPEK